MSEDIREELQGQVNNDETNESTSDKKSIKDIIFDEIVNGSNLVPEEIVRAAVDKVFSKLDKNDSYLVIEDVIEETMTEITNEYGEDETNQNHYHKLYSDLRDKFERNREELINNGIVTDIIKFDDDFEVTFDELNRRINETQKYLDEFFYIRDQKIAVIKDLSLTIDEKKERIDQINENSILSDIENPDVKREYELFNKSSDDTIMSIFMDENLTPEQVAAEIEKYENNWKDIVDKTYGIDIQNMNVLAKQIDVVMANTEKMLKREYKLIYEEFGIKKGSVEEKIFDAAFENNCNEQEYIDKMTQINIDKDENIIQIENQIAQIEAQLIDLDTRLGEMSEKEIADKIKELKAQKSDLIAQKADAISNLKDSLADELHSRFERMANYQRKALRFVALEEKFGKHKEYVLKSDLNQNVKKHNSLNDSMYFKNKKNLPAMKEKVSIRQQIDMEELAKNNRQNGNVAKEENAQTEEINNADTVENVQPEEPAKVEWHEGLTQEQIDELISDGIEPGDQEYYQYLMNHGVIARDNDEKMQEPEEQYVPEEINEENTVETQQDKDEEEKPKEKNKQESKQKNNGQQQVIVQTAAQQPEVKQNEENTVETQQDKDEEEKPKEKNKQESKQKNNGQQQVIVQTAAQQPEVKQNEEVPQQTSLREITDAESAKNVIGEFLKTNDVQRKMFLVDNGYAKLADAVATIKDNEEGITLSRKERKEITEALNSNLRNSLNETELRKKDGDIIALFNKIKPSKELTEQEKSKLFDELFKYNENKLPCIATSLITKENRDKLGQLLEGYGDLLIEGNLTQSEIENFDKYILNPLNANCIRHDIEEMGFWAKAANRFKSIFSLSRGRIKVGRGVFPNSQLKHVNEVKADIKSGTMISGPVGLADATYSLDEILNNDVNRTNNEQTKAPKITSQQEK